MISIYLDAQRAPPPPARLQNGQNQLMEFISVACFLVPAEHGCAATCQISCQSK